MKQFLRKAPATLKSVMGIALSLVLLAVLLVAPLPRALAADTPGNFSAQLIQDTTIRLTWDPVEDVDEYVLSYYDSDTGTNKDFVFVSKNETTYDFDDILGKALQYGTTYVFNVATLYNETRSAPSPSVTISTPSPPQEPTNLTAVANSSSSIYVDWDPVVGAAGYHLYYADTEDGTYSWLASMTEPGYPHEGLNPGTTVYYKVSAYNDAVESLKAGPVGATTGVPAPNAPSLSIAGEGLLGAKLSWNSVEYANNYEIYYKIADGVNYSLLDTVSTLSYIDNNQVVDVEYTYYVVAIGNGGTSPDSNIVKIGHYSSPAVPTNIVATPTSHSSIEVTWGAVDGADRYLLYRSDTEHGTYEQIGDITTPTYVDTGLDPETTYYYKVMAVKSDLESPLSDPASVTTFAVPPPDATVLSASALSSTEIVVSWDAVAGATGYTIYWSTEPTVPSSFTHLADVAAPTFEFTHAGLLSDTTYYYYVVVNYAAATSPDSNIASDTTFPGPMDITATAESPSSIIVEWDRVDRAAYYILYRSTDPSGLFTQLAIVDNISSTPLFTDTGLFSNTTYYYRVEAFEAEAKLTESPVTNATTPSPIYQLQYYRNHSNDDSASEFGGTYAQNYFVSLSTLSDFGWSAPSGYKFLGWSLAKDGAVVSNPYSMPGHDVELYARWEAVTYEITYNRNYTDGDATAQSGGSYAENDSVALSGLPSGWSRSGYTFLGWSLTRGGAIVSNPYQMPGSNVTLYARWQQDSANYTITYNRNHSGSDSTTTAGGSHAGGATVSLSGLPAGWGREGHSFLGWSLTRDGIVVSNAYTMPNSNVTLYARFSANLYTVTYDYNDGTGRTTSQQLAYGSTVPRPADPTRTGYAFAGWTYNGGAWNFSNTMPAHNITLVAQWTRTSYTVTFDYNDNTGRTATQQVNVGATVPQPANPTRTGYTFAGWNYNGSAFNFNTAMPARNITLVAQWDPLPGVTSYTVTFDYADGRANTTMQVEPGELVAKPTDPTRDGYTFISWTRGGAEWNFGADRMPEANITLVAGWQENEGDGENPIPPVNPTIPPYPGDPNPDFEAQIGNQTGNIFQDIANGHVPIGGPLFTNYWSLLSLLLGLYGFISALISAIQMLSRNRKENREGRRLKLIGSAAVILGTLAAILFLILNSLSNPMVFINSSTIPILIVVVAHIATMVIYSMKRKREDEENELVYHA